MRTHAQRPPTQVLADFDFHVRQRVYARGREGVIESIAWDMASGKRLYTVAHDPRTRLTYQLADLRPVAAGASR